MTYRRSKAPASHSKVRKPRPSWLKMWDKNTTYQILSPCFYHTINYLSSLQSPLEQDRGKIRCAGRILHNKKYMSSELDAIITIEKFKSRKSESSLCKLAVLQFFSISSPQRAELGLHLGNGGLCAMSIPVTQIDTFHGIGKHRGVFPTREGH